MIFGIIHKGSGVGNQLHRYVMTRVLAADKGYSFEMIAPEFFKARSFMPNAIMGEAYEFGVGVAYDIEYPSGKVLPKSTLPVWEEATNYYNPEINFIPDGTIIDGEFQDERYFMHRMDDIREWLKTEPLDMADDLCIINFRGGEFTLFPELFLPNSYWEEAINIMLKENPNMRFEVHTDDENTASRLFPQFEVIHDVALNWRSIRYAKYLILANSSFPILPSLMNEDAKLIIAPRYWARRNTGEWSMPQNYYKGWCYI